ncbi:hypothetical protein AGMMS49992_00930 [Clostridia bacterium]|nr:hypothetical protein AGMMS49992_00930 [Clostridia bacterium]
MRYIAKGILVIALIASVIFTMIPLASASGYAETAVVNNPNPADRLNLRASPSVNSTSYGKYYNGTRVRILEYTNADWVKVWIGPSAGVAEGNHQDPNMGYIQGYMLRKYLAFGDAANKVVWAGPWMKISVSDSRVYPLRDKVNGSRSIAEFPNGTYVQVIGIMGSWYHVVIDAFTGFLPASELVSANPGGGSSGGGSSGGGGSIVGTTAVVNNPNPNDRLNLRTAARTSSSSFCKFYSGTPVIIVEDTNAQWARVQIGYGTGAVYGYMSKQYLAFGERAANVKSRVGRYYSDMTRWSLYAGATYGSVIVGSFTYQTPFDRLGIRESDGWWYVCVYGDQGTKYWGWMNAEDQHVRQ